jgi:hypothetical protein
MTTQHEVRRAIMQAVRNTDRFPTLQELCTALNFSAEQVYKYMNSLVEDKYLEKNGMWYKFAADRPESVHEIAEMSNDVQEPVQEIAPEVFEEMSVEIKEPMQESTQKKVKIINKPKNKKQTHIYGIQVRIIQAVMTIIGTGASIISIYYTNIWLIEFLPFIPALLLSIIMVGFSVFAFEIIILFFTGHITGNKWVQGIVITSFTLLWLVATSFSIFSTIAGQVNKEFQKREKSEMTAESNSKEQWQLLQEQKIELKERLNDYRHQIQTYNQILSGMNSVKNREGNQNAWNDINYKLYTAQGAITSILGKIEEVRTNERKIIDDSKGKSFVSKVKTKTRIDFYVWLAKIFGVDPDKIQFFMALMPAVFVDLIAPFGLATALFLKNKY